MKKGIFVVIVLLILGLNFAQFFLGFGFQYSHNFIQNGIPFAFYEHWMLLSKGRILYIGIVGNAIFAVALATIASRMVGLIHRPK